MMEEETLNPTLTLNEEIQTGLWMEGFPDFLTETRIVRDFFNNEYVVRGFTMWPLLGRVLQECVVPII